MPRSLHDTRFDSRRVRHWLVADGSNGCRATPLRQSPQLPGLSRCFRGLLHHVVWMRGKHLFMRTLGGRAYDLPREDGLADEAEMHGIRRSGQRSAKSARSRREHDLCEVLLQVAIICIVTSAFAASSAFCICNAEVQLADVLQLHLKILRRMRWQNNMLPARD